MSNGGTAFKYGVAESGPMSDDHRARADAVEVRLLAVRMEIDDDDEDVLEIEVEMVNESSMPLGGLDASVHTSDGRRVAPTTPITSLGPGAQRPLRFEVRLGDGTWTFSATCMGGTVELGPYDADFTFEAPKGRRLANAMGSSMFVGAFSDQLGEFGQVQERGFIDPSQVVMTTFTATNAQGGSTIVRPSGTEEEPPAAAPPWATPSSTVSDPLSMPFETPTPLVQTDVLTGPQVDPLSMPIVAPTPVSEPDEIDTPLVDPLFAPLPGAVKAEPTPEPEAAVEHAAVEPAPEATYEDPLLSALPRTAPTPPRFLPALPPALRAVLPPALRGVLLPALRAVHRTRTHEVLPWLMPSQWNSAAPAGHGKSSPKA